MPTDQSIGWKWVCQTKHFFLGLENARWKRQYIWACHAFYILFDHPKWTDVCWFVFLRVVDHLVLIYVRNTPKMDAECLLIWKLRKGVPKPKNDQNSLLWLEVVPETLPKWMLNACWFESWGKGCPNPKTIKINSSMLPWCVIIHTHLSFEMLLRLEFVVPSIFEVRFSKMFARTCS